MAFDPLAFLKPEKAFTMEGLLSRDMFEKFAADDEQHYAHIAFGADEDYQCDDEEYSIENRLEMIASFMDCDDMPDRITQWLNQGFLLVLAMAPFAYALFLVDDDEQQTSVYRVNIDDGPPLSRDELISLAHIMETKIEQWYQGEVTTNANFVPGDIEQINMLLITKLWILKHAKLTLEIDATDI